MGQQSREAGLAVAGSRPGGGTNGLGSRTNSQRKEDRKQNYQSEEAGLTVRGRRTT